MRFKSALARTEQRRAELARARHDFARRLRWLFAGLVAAALVLGFARWASAGQVFVIKGDATDGAGQWNSVADGTTATTTTTGFNAVGNSKWTHRTFAANPTVKAPYGSTSKGWIETAAGSSGNTLQLQSGNHAHQTSGSDRDYWFGAWVQMHPTVTPKGGIIWLCADNGSGKVRVSCGTPHELTTGDTVFISGVAGTTEANSALVAKTVTVVDDYTFDLPTTYTNAYTSGGAWGTMPDWSGQSNNVAFFTSAGSVTRIEFASAGAPGGNCENNGPYSKTGWTAWQSTPTTYASRGNLSQFGTGAQGNPPAILWDTWAWVVCHWRNSSVSGTITNVTNSGGLFKVTCVGHGLTTGDKIGISGVTGTGISSINNAAASPWTITKVDNDNFTLNSSTFAGTYSSGGTFGKADGCQEVYLNGVLVSDIQLVGSAAGANFPGSNFTWQFPFVAIPNVVCRVCPTIEAWNGTDMPVRPLYALEDSTSELKSWWLPYAPAASGGLTQGRFWSYVTDTGTVVYQDFNVSSGDQGPYCGRLKISGDGSTNAFTSIDQVGAVSYNEYGHAHFTWKDISVPTGCTLALSLTGASDDVAIKTLTIASGLISNGFDTLPWNHAKRYHVSIHLKNDGTLTFSIIDCSDTDGAIQSTPIVFSSQWTGGWTPQNLGKLKMTASPLSTSVIEVGQIALTSWLTLVGMDSNTCTQFDDGDTLTPTLWVSDDLGVSVGHSKENALIPGGFYPQKPQGFARRYAVHVGRTDMNSISFLQNVVGGMVAVRGVRVMILDGALQDLYGWRSTGKGIPYVIGPTRDPSERAQQSAANVGAMADLLTVNECKLHVATMARRLRRLAITSATKANPVVLTLAETPNIPQSGRCTVVGVTSVPAANGVVVGFTYSGNQFTLTGVDGSASGSGGATAGYVQEFYENENQTDTAAGTTCYVDRYNAALRTILSQKQKDQLISLSDVHRYQLATPGYWPNNKQFWVSLQQYKINQSAYWAMTKIHELERVVTYIPASPTGTNPNAPRRLSQGMLGRQ